MSNATSPRTPAEWTEYLRSIQDEAFLVGPLQEIREIPEGFDITVTRVLIDVEGETFWVGRSKQGEERALGKSAIERLATAAAASSKVTRTDDRRHPRKCEYNAVAVMRLLDGSQQFAEASRAYDMTEEGTDWISIFDQAASKAYAKAIEDRAPEDAAQARAREAGRSAAFAALGAMHRNAETKARLRALRTVLGLRSKYLRSDLERKAFIVVRLSATGRSSDPQLRREFGRMLFANAIGATNALFGPAAAAPQHRALPMEQEEPAPYALPAPDDDVIDHDTGEVTQGNPGRSAQPTHPAAERPPTGNRGASSGETPDGAPASPESRPKAYKINLPGDSGHGKEFFEAETDELERYMMSLSEKMATGEIPPAGMKSAKAKLESVAGMIDRRKQAGEASW